jgi:soluble lytic murein transglycosylase-like protein
MQISRRKLTIGACLTASSLLSTSGAAEQTLPTAPWRQLIETICEEEGFEDSALVEAVMLVESRGNASAVSAAGAYGLMQLMPATARQLGVTLTDPEDNIRGGVRFLQWAIDRYGLYGGIAAYNCGPRCGPTAESEWPTETRAYLPAVLHAYEAVKAARVATLTATSVEEAGGRSSYSPRYTRPE